LFSIALQETIEKIEKRVEYNANYVYTICYRNVVIHVKTIRTTLARKERFTDQTKIIVKPIPFIQNPKKI